MQLFRHYRDFSAKINSPCVVTVGNFDGMHLGHRALFSQMLTLAKEKGLMTVAFVFEPQPQEFFFPEKAQARLSTLRDKAEVLMECGIDVMICQAFNQSFSSITASQFIQTVLIEHLHVKELFVGHDFRFGSNREGAIDLLKQASQDANFTVHEHKAVLYEGERISSTRVRQCLAMGEMMQAASLLGRPYAMKGRVIHGDKRGRTIGFPTANLALKRRISPVSGVFVVRIRGLERDYFGVANVGKRPTLDGIRHLLEVHIFDFNCNLYAQSLKIEFLAKLRDERRFANVTELQEQIARDCLEARTILNSCDTILF